MRQGRRNTRTYVIVVLSVLVLIMSVGFAVFSTNLNISGTSSIASSWCVGFDNRNTNSYQVTKGLNTGKNPTGSIGFSGTSCSTNFVPTASLGATFYQPGDKIEYTLTIANKGSLAAAIESITVDDQNITENQTINKGNIILKIYMPEKTTLEAKTGITTMMVSAEFQNTTDISLYQTGETQSITVGINVKQSTGSNSMSSSSIKTVYALSGASIADPNDVFTLEDLGDTYSSCAATGQLTCIRYTLEDNVVTGADVCFIKDNIEYCLKGGYDECNEQDYMCTYTGTKSVFNQNVSTLQTALAGIEPYYSDDDHYTYSYHYGENKYVVIFLLSDGTMNIYDYWNGTGMSPFYCEINYGYSARCRQSDS